LLDEKNTLGLLHNIRLLSIPKFIFRNIQKKVTSQTAFGRKCVAEEAVVLSKR
jgi:hypothetical protein